MTATWPPLPHAWPLPAGSSTAVIICALQWRKWRLRDVMQLRKDADPSQTQLLWLQNLHPFHSLGLL